MPVRLTPGDRAFVERVAEYCGRGLTEPEMAAAEELVLTTFRSRLLRCGFTIAKQTERELVRTGSGETFWLLVERGEIVTAEEAVAVAR